MSIPAEHQDRFVYHFTAIDNLTDIVMNGLLCTNKKTHLSHRNIACADIQETRHDMDVGAGPGGKVHDYVPFYFSERTAMSIAVIKGKNIDQRDLIFLKLKLSDVPQGKFVFTDRACNRENTLPNWYDDFSKLPELDWSIIKDRHWSRGYFSDDQKHKKMSELLLHEKVPIGLISEIAVWGRNQKIIVEQIYSSNNISAPKIEYGISDRPAFFYTEWSTDPKKSVVTGPNETQKLFEKLVEDILEARRSQTQFKYESKYKLLLQLNVDFSPIPELKELINLNSANDFHFETVEKHSRSVRKNLEQIQGYSELDIRQKNVLKLAAYFHDMGKGKCERDTHGKQKVDDEHGIYAIPMLKRILSEEIENLSSEDIRQICGLVIYDDLIGAIAGQGRNKEQLLSFVKKKENFEMLALLSQADVKSLIRSSRRRSISLNNPTVKKWLQDIEQKLPELRSWVEQKLEERDNA